MNLDLWCKRCLIGNVGCKFLSTLGKDFPLFLELFCLSRYSVLIPVYAFSFFIPTIINELGYKSTTAQLLSTPPYVAGCFFTVLLGILSDKYSIRGPFVLGCTSLAIAGYAILYGSSKAELSYAGTIIAASGVFPSIPIVLAWAGGSAGGDIKRGVAIAMTIGFGNLGG